MGRGDSLPSHSSDSSTDIDEAAKELIRVSRINITELELLEFTGSNVSDDGGFENRATPLAAGGGTHEVGGVVFKTSASETASSSASSRINVTDNSALGLPRAVVRMACSKGTYVRAFARDLGEALGSGAHLDSLQRSRSGIFRVENALTVEQAIECLKQ
jgi:tRNA U55 pseudouridine synthase TruB